MDWPTAAVLIAVVIAVMAVLSTYIAGRNLKKLDRANRRGESSVDQSLESAAPQ